MPYVMAASLGGTDDSGELSLVGLIYGLTSTSTPVGPTLTRVILESPRRSFESRRSFEHLLHLSDAVKS